MQDPRELKSVMKPFLQKPMTQINTILSPGLKIRWFNLPAFCLPLRSSPHCLLTNASLTPSIDNETPSFQLHTLSLKYIWIYLATATASNSILWQKGNRPQNTLPARNSILQHYCAIMKLHSASAWTIIAATNSESIQERKDIIETMCMFSLFICRVKFQILWFIIIRERKGES